MKTFLSKTFAMWFKRLGFAGAIRWRTLYWTYKIWPGLHIRDEEWAWVLNYLPSLSKGQHVNVLVVGATSSLFVYELGVRDYYVRATDIRPYQERINHPNIKFTMHDITTWACESPQDFVVCISVLEHIPKDKQHAAFDNMMKSLKPGGRLLLTIPTREFAQGHEWEGFSITDFDLHEDRARIIEYTERKGQICMAIERLA